MGAFYANFGMHTERGILEASCRRAQNTLRCHHGSELRLESNGREREKKGEYNKCDEKKVRRATAGVTFFSSKQISSRTDDPYDLCPLHDLDLSFEGRYIPNLVFV